MKINTKDELKYNFETFKQTLCFIFLINLIGYNLI